MTCVFYPFTNYLGCGCFVLLLVAAYIIGNSRGSHIRHVTSNLIRYFLDLMILWYAAAIFKHLCWPDWSRDDHDSIDIPLLSFIQGTTVSVILFNLLTFKPNTEGLIVFIHIIVGLACNGFLFMSVMAFHKNERLFWIFASIVFSLIAIYHVVTGSHIAYTGRPRFIRALAFLLVVYYTVYLCSTIMSPFHQNLISFGAYEIVSLINNVLISSVFCSFVLMYGWALRHQPSSQIVSLKKLDDYLFGLSPNDLKQYRFVAHTY